MDILRLYSVWVKRYALSGSEYSAIAERLKPATSYRAGSGVGRFGSSRTSVAINAAISTPLPMLTFDMDMTPNLRTLYAEHRFLSWKGVAGGKRTRSRNVV